MSDEDIKRFSKRHGYSPADRKISIREDAPEELRSTLLSLAEKYGLNPGKLRDVTCAVLRKLPNPGNWSPSDIWDEVVRLVKKCEWFQIYDLIEAVYVAIDNPPHCDEFEEKINEYFREAGIGWQLSGGVIETRGSEAFDSSVCGAIAALDQSNRQTAGNELHEALRDLSRRPDPDITGAVQHAMAALECIARDCTGKHKATLGQILKQVPDLLPPPLDEAAEKAWGYASEMGRHLREGRAPDRAEAELIVGLAATLANFLDGRSSH